MNDDQTKIDVGGTIREGVVELSGLAIFAVVFLTGVGLLFAPWFADFAREGLMKKYGAYADWSKRALVERDIRRLKGWLWCVAIATWTIFLIAYYNRF